MCGKKYEKSELWTFKLCIWFTLASKAAMECKLIILSMLFITVQLLSKFYRYGTSSAAFKCSFGICWPSPTIWLRAYQIINTTCQMSYWIHLHNVCTFYANDNSKGYRKRKKNQQQKMQKRWDYACPFSHF